MRTMLTFLTLAMFVVKTLNCPFLIMKIQWKNGLKVGEGRRTLEDQTKKTQIQYKPPPA